jgi:hypothetical protein
MNRPLKSWIILFLFLVIHTISLSQSTMSRADSLAIKLVERHKQINSLKQSRPGYRVQIYFGTDRAKAQEIRTDFLVSYPTMGAYLVYHQPYFKIRVGDFYSRIEALGFLNKIASGYSTAFIVSDDVKLPTFE